MQDLFGVPVNIGDKVVYTTGGRGDTYLDTGTVEKINLGIVSIRSSRGRLLTNPRNSREIMSVTPTATLHPELFI
ncbi:MAG: mechanosensitive ion channel domain-containing protein [Sulfuricurvum sp.]